MAEAGGEAGQILQFSNIYHVVRGDRTEGTLKMNAKGFAFKSKATGAVLTGANEASIRRQITTCVHSC